MDGMAMLTASGDADGAEQVRDAILDAARDIAARGVSPQDFERMKKSALGRRVRGLDSFEATCFRLCAYHFTGYDYFRFPSLYREVRREEIQEFLWRVVTPERCGLSVVTPIHEEAAS